VNIELDRMLEAGIVEPIKESKRISPMVVQEKKILEIKICVDIRKINDAYLHDPFHMLANVYQVAYACH
jgi:hypothetical protein